MNAAITDGSPNRINTFLLIFFPTKKNLKILLEKWTSPVNAIATSVGKKIIITGVKIVPRPKPEKKVSIAVVKDTIDNMKISNIKKMEYHQKLFLHYHLLKSNFHLKIFLAKT